MKGTIPDLPLGRVEPRIYVVSLADCNNGCHHGRWVSVLQEPAQIYVQIADMLARSAVPLAEEWAIHDYEGFGCMAVSEYESIEVLARVARGIDEYGLVFTHWVEVVGMQDLAALDDFDEHYLGTWESLGQYGEVLLNDIGFDLDCVVPAWLVPYIKVDFDRLGHDLAIDLCVVEDGPDTHLFVL